MTLIDPLALQLPEFGVTSPSLNVRIARSPLYARAFDRFGPAQDPNSPYALEDDDKRKLFKRGLLEFAAAVSRPNGGNLASAISSGLLAAHNGMGEGAQQHVNDAYRADIMQRTRDEMAANTAKNTAYSHLYNPDGTISQQGVAEVQKADPQGYLSIHDKLYPEQVNHWQPKEINFNGAAGTVLWNEKTGEMKTLDGQPFGPQAAVPGAAPQVMGGALADAVQQVESGGNPFAVSPKGALGPMQTMPGTLADPGFGVAPARDNTPQEQGRVGRDYLAALTQKYGLTGGLAAYNWGPGNWQAALGRYGSPDAALAHAPAETQAYVPKVLARAGGVNSAIPSQTASGTIPALPFGFAPKQGADDTPKLSQNYRWADSAHTRAEPVPGSEADQAASGLDADAVRQAAMDWIFNGKAPPAGRSGGSSIYKQVSNARAQIAKEYGISPMQVSTQAGRVKAAQKALATVQQRSSMLGAQMKTVEDNAAYAIGVAKTLPRSQYPLVNRALQSGKAFLGDPQTAKFVTALNSVQTEYAKAMSGATGAAGSTDAAMAHARVLINDAMNNGQLEAALQAMKAEMENQQHNYENQMYDLSARMDQLTPSSGAQPGGIDDLLRKYGHH